MGFRCASPHRPLLLPERAVLPEPPDRVLPSGDPADADPAPTGDPVLRAGRAHLVRARADLHRMREHTRDLLDTQTAGATTS